MIDFSVVIPHKNSPDLLQRCLDSIPDDEHIEVIAVDDNSSSENVALLRQLPLHSNARIIYTTEARGAGYARNVALKQAQGKWLIFADADDYFLKDSFRIFSWHIDSDADLIYFLSTSAYSDTGERAKRHENNNQKVRSCNLSDAHSVNLLKFNYDEPWGKMVKAELVKQHDIVFDETRWANDVMFSARVGRFAQKVDIDLSEVYCVTVAKGSLVNQRSLESRRCRYEVTLQMNQYLRENGLGKYQHSIMYSLRKTIPYGLKAVIDFIRLGRKYDANFFAGSSSWLRNALHTLFHNEDKDKQSYLIKS